MSSLLQAARDQLDQRIATLTSNGVKVIDPRQVYIAPEVQLNHIQAGAELYPGTRIQGARTILGHGVKIGSEGPVSLIDVAVDDGTEIASGFLSSAVLLQGVRVGSNAHIRPYTILEEEASTAHAVGLKHTVLMSYVTLGSLINFCDGIISGGTSRSNHTEVGSGFIHFNFTPWGLRGDKATPTMVGDVCRGVFLSENRIFLGGLSGLVGPAQVGFGSLAVAGQIIREDVHDDTILSTIPKERHATVNVNEKSFSERKYLKNLQYISNLVALREWYIQIRVQRAAALSKDHYRTAILSFAANLITLMINERMQRLSEYLAAFERPLPVLRCRNAKCPIDVEFDLGVDHPVWVKSLSSSKIRSLRAWLRQIVDTTWSNDPQFKN